MSASVRVCVRERKSERDPCKIHERESEREKEREIKCVCERKRDRSTRVFQQGESEDAARGHQRRSRSSHHFREVRLPREVDVRLPGNRSSNSHVARPVRRIITVIVDSDQQVVSKEMSFSVPITNAARFYIHSGRVQYKFINMQRVQYSCIGICRAQYFYILVGRARNKLVDTPAMLWDTPCGQTCQIITFLKCA